MDFGFLHRPTGDFWRTLSYGLDTTAELPPERGLVILNTLW